MTDRLARHRSVYERHQAGETYAEIGHDLGISISRARQLAVRWRRELIRVKSYDELQCEVIELKQKLLDLKAENEKLRERVAEAEAHYENCPYCWDGSR